MITKKQKQVLKAINDFIVNNNYSPSVRELASVLNLKSTSTIQGYLDRLQANGYIERNKNMPRTLHILKYQEV
jgi:SOS-response transcriptional repressor LexA